MALEHQREMARASAALGSPMATVRVMSVVPSRYWAPESIRKRLPGSSRRLVARVTR